VAFVERGDQLSVLINGRTFQTVSTNLVVAQPIASAHILSLEPDGMFSSYQTQGLVDELRIFDRSLTEQEVQAEMSPAPFAVAPAYVVAACRGVATPVELNASASYSVSGSNLTFGWSAPDAISVDNASAAVTHATFPVGLHTATVTVASGAGLSTASTQVAIQDVTPPSLDAVFPAEPGIYSGANGAPTGAGPYVVVGSLTSTVQAHDDCSGVASVAFHVDDGAGAVVTSPPYRFSYAPDGVGLQYRTLTITVTDRAGNAATPIAIPLTVMSAAPQSPLS
jgi:hypothetical protein